MSASRVLRVREGEWRVTALVVALMFVSMSGIALGESGINALFFERIGTDALPLMYLAQAGATLIAMFALMAVLGRVRRRWVYLASPLLLAAVVLGERAVLIVDVRWIYPALWVTVASAMLMQAIGLWGIAGSVTDARQAKRLFPLFGAGGILGSVVGGLLTAPLASIVGAENLLFVWAGALTVASMLGRLALGYAATTGPEPSSRRRASPFADLRDGFAYVRRSGLLMAMAAAAVLFSVLFFSLYLPFATAATERFAEADELAGFFGLVWAVVTGVAFLVSVLLTNRLFAWFGVAAMVLVLPLLYAGSFGLLIVLTGFVTLVSLRIATGVWLQGVASPAWETLVNVVPDERRDQTRAFLNGGPAQVGTAIAGVVALVGQDVLSARWLAAIGLGAALLTLATTLVIRRSYVGALLEAVRAGRPQVFAKPSAWTPIALDADADACLVLVRSMRSDDVRVRRLAFQLAAEVSAGLPPDAIVDGLDDEDPIVRRAAIEVLESASAGSRETLHRMMADPDPAVRAAAAVRALVDAQDPDAAACLVSLLADADPLTRRAGLEQLRPVSGVSLAQLIEPLLRDPVAEVRAAAFDALAMVDPSRAIEPALEGMRDAEPSVRLAAGRALGSAGSRGVEHVLRALGDPTTSEAAVEAARRVRSDGRTDRVLSFVGSAAERATRARALAAAIPAGDEGEALLRDAVLERGRRDARCALWAVTMLAPNREAIETGIESLERPSSSLGAALEAIEIASPSTLVRPLLSLWEPLPTASGDGGAWLASALDDDDPLIRRCAEMLRDRREGATMPRTPTATSLIERMLLLRGVPLFSGLSPSDLERVARVAEERGYADGDTIASEGSPGDELHVVTEGTIRVVKDLGGDEREIARRTSGDVVGEMAVVTRTPRIASLVADGVVRTLRIGHREFESMLRERPDVALAVMRVLAERLAEGASPPGPE